ncbi:hypothetical protein [uncultured Halomonas sp.]|uniref:hypothetical protein n=1 Tax=uncultured Halomonas sp. TaxID=173971 RepID=UPI002611B03F|nr:hypothetical protein [uncultured Halomonas sp.]
MGTVTSMRRDPLEFCYTEADGRDLKAVALVGIDGEGNYVLTAAGTSPEEMLMMAELLREHALESASE